MDLQTVLRRIDIWLAANPDSSDTELSRRAGTKSGDTIRNWRRAVRNGKESAGATVRKIEAIADAMGVPRSWLEGAGPDDLASLEKDRKQLTDLYDLLKTAAFRQAAIRHVEALLDAEASAERGASPKARAAKRPR